MLGERTSLTLEGDYTNSRYLQEFGLPAVGTVLPNPNGSIPRNRLSSEPDYFIAQTIARVGYRFEHQFSDNWSLQNAFRVGLNREENSGELGAFPVSLANDNRTLNRRATGFTFFRNTYDLALNLSGNFSTGSINHQLVFGVDLGKIEQLLNDR